MDSFRLSRNIQNAEFRARDDSENRDYGFMENFGYDQPSQPKESSDLYMIKLAFYRPRTEIRTHSGSAMSQKYMIKFIFSVKSLKYTLEITRFGPFA